MPRQLTLDLPSRTALGRDDFFVSAANTAALTRLDATDGWPLAKLALVGPEGAGKTHLAHVWAREAGGRVLAAAQLPALDVAGVASGLAIDDADRLPDGGETALFHLHNHMASAALPLLLVGREAPARWPVDLPDLKSRLTATDVVRIEAPDDALLAAVLVKLFADRGVMVAPHLIDWLVPRMGRSFGDAARVVAALDAEALSAGKPVTRVMASDVLTRIQATDR